MSMSPANTKQRILAIAAELFARQGYTGTSIADIAHELGTTTAALYYHFPSKADILGGLLTQPLAVYERIIASLDSGSPTAEDLLNAFVDLAAEASDLGMIVDRDPAVLGMIDERLPRTSAEMTEQVITALAAPGGGDRAAILRAHAAFGVVKGASMAAMAMGDGKLSDADRAEILGAALRALGVD
jgi:AcrR family transcriptional regulator